MTMTAADVLSILFSLPEPGDGSDLVAFVKKHGPPPESAGKPEDPFRRLMRVASHGDRRSASSIAGHQAAIRRLFPATPEIAVCAFCISEERGPHPKYIDTALTPDGSGNFRMNGSKRWGSAAPDSDLLYVAASIGRDGERNDLRMVALPADRAGISFDLEPYLDYGTEMRIADIAFDDVAISADEVLADDAYLTYIKPFRLFEDVYNTAGLQVGLFRLGRDHDWADEQLERLAALVCQAAAVSSTDMSSPESIILLTDYLRASGEFWTDTWQAWTDPPQEVIDLWAPDRGLLDVAARARETRRQTAWVQLKA